MDVPADRKPILIPDPKAKPHDYEVTWDSGEVETVSARNFMLLGGKWFAHLAGGGRIVREERIRSIRRCSNGDVITREGEIIKGQPSSA